MTLIGKLTMRFSWFRRLVARELVRQSEERQQKRKKFLDGMGSQRQEWDEEETYCDGCNRFSHGIACPYC